MSVERESRLIQCTCGTRVPFQCLSAHVKVEHVGDGYDIQKCGECIFQSESIAYMIQHCQRFGHSIVNSHRINSPRQAVFQTTLHILKNQNRRAAEVMHIDSDSDEDVIFVENHPPPSNQGGIEGNETDRNVDVTNIIREDSDDGPSSGSILEKTEDLNTGHGKHKKSVGVWKKDQQRCGDKEDTFQLSDHAHRVESSVQLGRQIHPNLQPKEQTPKHPPNDSARALASTDIGSVGHLRIRARKKTSPGSSVVCSVRGSYWLQAGLHHNAANVPASTTEVKEKQVPLTAEKQPEVCRTQRRKGLKDVSRSVPVRPLGWIRGTNIPLRAKKSIMGPSWNLQNKSGVTTRVPDTGTASSSRKRQADRNICLRCLRRIRDDETDARNHVVSKHLEPLWKCQMCSRMFSKRGGVLHCKRMHQNEAGVQRVTLAVSQAEFEEKVEEAMNKCFPGCF